MSDPKVLFLHGLGSVPGGIKVKYLKSNGCKVFNPYLPKSSWEESLKAAQDVIDNEKPDVIVGSSRGGAIALSLQTRGAKLVLVAPAWKRFGGNTSLCDESTVVIHSKNDKIIPYSDSVELKENYGVTLISCGENHRMRDRDALEAILDAVKWIMK
jgi:predicted alpha/beta hydrolase family esterase